MISHKTTIGKVTKQRKPRKLKDRGFPNLILNRNVISRPNMVWAIDGTFLDITLNGQAGTKHYLLSAVDPATNKLIFTKTSYVGDKKAKKTFTASFIIKLIENALVNERVSQPLMIHVDRASQFTSKKFVEFVDKHPRQSNRRRTT